MPLRSTLVPPAPRPSAAANRFDAWLAGLPARTGLRVLQPTARVPFDVVLLVPGGAVVRVAGRGRRLVVSLWAPGSARATVPIREPEVPELAARGVRRVGLMACPGASGDSGCVTVLDVHAPPTSQAALALPLTEVGRSADPLDAATLGVRADPDELDGALALALGALLPWPAGTPAGSSDRAGRESRRGGERVRTGPDEGDTARARCRSVPSPSWPRR